MARKKKRQEQTRRTDGLPEGWQWLRGPEPKRSAEEEALIEEMRRTAEIIPAEDPDHRLPDDWWDNKPPIPGLSLSDLCIELRG